MATKTSIIKSAFDKLYHDLGKDLKDFLPSLSPRGPWTIKSRSLKVGIKWHLIAKPNPFLLFQIKQSELSIVTSRYPTAKGYVCLADRFFRDPAGNPVLYLASDHPETYFLLLEEWGDGDGNKSISDLINSFASSFKKEPYISAEAETELTTPKKQNLINNPKPPKGTVATGATPGVSPLGGVYMDDNDRFPLNMILYGPPGTGKTYNTIFKTLDVMSIPPKDSKGAPTSKGTWFENEDADRDRALKEFNVLKGAGRIMFTTFHQSMSYEDFIEGIKPTLDITPVGYTLDKGLFKLISENASSHPEWNYVLIIDEINRGNIANIFGELITLIEDDKRTTKWDKTKGVYVDNPEAIRVKLPYSKDKELEFGVPGNLYIIGTMNTADRSVEALDSALRRRFSFKEMMPKPNLLKTVTIDGLGKTLEELLSIINERIELLKDREHQIGHSYFMGFVDKDKKPTTVKPEELKSVFADKIIPLLQEYFYGDYEKIQLVVGDGFIKTDTKHIEFAANSSDVDIPEKRFSIERSPNMEEALKTLLVIK